MDFNLRKFFFADAKETKSPLTINSEKRLCSLGNITEVYLLVRATRQKYVARIAVISLKESLKSKKPVQVHIWTVTDRGATIKLSSTNKKKSFKKRKANFQKLGETKNGKCLVKIGLWWS